MSWQANKATKMIEHEIEQIGQSQFPDDQFCAGLTQMAYALGLIDDIEELEMSERAADAVIERRKQLREKKIEHAIGRIAA